MVVGFLACESEYRGAYDGTEAEPDKVPPREATLHVVAALFAELDELSGFG